MRFIIGFALVAALAWAGYWWIGARGMEAAFTGWFDAREAEGWQAEVSALEVNGFPNRFDTVLTEPRLADPGTGLGWQAPFLQFLSLSYRPTQVIAAFPQTQTVLTPVGDYTLETTEMQASLFLGASTRLPLHRTTLVAQAPVLRADDWQAQADTYRMAMYETEGGVNTYDLGLEMTALVLPEALQARVDPADLLPAALDVLRLDAQVAFDAQWDIGALETARPQPTRIALREARGQWGDVMLRATGTLEMDARGMPTGKIDVKAANWRTMLAVARRSGALPESVADLMERGLEGLSRLSGRSDTLDVPLTFDRGSVRIGFIPLGQTGPIRLR
ncbi:DUF2125 domain-containing protein [Tropicimonas sp. S265A]|uniref:DUF2125 domain-containing protein n=1 Tax=Tropicimonas sp. S265A TaxID=3415134 RepID=UPI003C7CE294